MRTIVSGLILLISALSIQSIQAQQPFAAAELFTSEGCNTCPPAERLLSELKTEAEKNKQNIYFLEYHVDYWNRLGWKDPFSKNQFTLRQENYSRVLPGKELYTPQLVINGETEVNGSDKKAAQELIQSYQVAEESGAKAKTQDEGTMTTRAYAGGEDPRRTSSVSLRDLVERR